MLESIWGQALCKYVLVWWCVCTYERESRLRQEVLWLQREQREHLIEKEIITAVNKCSTRTTSEAVEKQEQKWEGLRR